MSSKIVVATPTGNIGGALVRHLLDAGEGLILLARRPERLDAGVRERTEVRVGDLADADFVARAVEGAESLFWLTPNDFAAQDVRAWYETMARSARAAVERGGVRRVVNLSSAGAHRAQGLGPVSLLQLVENALNDTGAAVTHLRPGYFFENYLAHVQSIAQANTIFDTANNTASLPMVATRDIAEVAAQRLRDRSWAGVSYRGIHGPKNLTFDEAADEIGAALGRPVRHVRISPEEAREVFLGMGASEAVVRAYQEMSDGFSNGLEPAEPRTPETTTPTTLRRWAAEVLQPAVESAAEAL
jgi:Predicted nucleoside-diphosphate-sugar epimerases